MTSLFVCVTEVGPLVENAQMLQCYLNYFQYCFGYFHRLNDLLLVFSILELYQLLFIQIRLF